MKYRLFALTALIACMMIVAHAAGPSGDAALGSRSYDDFEPNETCAECHTGIARQYEQSLMSTSFTHHWEYPTQASGRRQPRQ
jgi:hypothetical protein